MPDHKARHHALKMMDEIESEHDSFDEQEDIQEVVNANTLTTE